jgi:hypothetical protein
MSEERKLKPGQPRRQHRYRAVTRAEAGLKGARKGRCSARPRGESVAGRYGQSRHQSGSGDRGRPAQARREASATDRWEVARQMRLERQRETFNK